MAKLRDIAEHLGMSESTVSRVLNGKGRVSEATRARVLAYAREVDYHPNGLAVRLKQQRSNTVGVLVPDINNVFYSTLFKEIDKHLRRAGLAPILFDSNEDEVREAEFVKYLQAHSVDGMIVATSGADIYKSLSDELLDRIAFIDNRPHIDEGYRFVGSENELAAHALTQHVIDRGHRSVATVVGAMGESSAIERLAGFKRCLAENDIDVPGHWIVHTNFLYEDGLRRARVLLTREPRPTAIIAQNNVLAYAAIKVAFDLGISVPEDLAVACFDHVDAYGFMRPVVTSAVQSVSDLATAAARSVIAGIEGDDEIPRETILEVEFRLGETS